MTRRSTDTDSKCSDPVTGASTALSVAGPSVPSLSFSGHSGSATVTDTASTESAILSPTPSRSALALPSVDDLEAGMQRPVHGDLESGLLPPPPPEFERPRTPAGRAAKIVRRIPGVDSVLRIANIILGPSHRQIPPPPNPRLSLAATCNRKSGSVSLDMATTRVSRRWKLQQLWFPYLLLWAMGFVLLIRAAYYLPSSPEFLGCTSTFFPDWPPDNCGVNGTECAAYLEPGTYRCPGGCHTTTLGNPRWIGNETVDKVPLIIGGGDDAGTYRGDSWICAAGVHAGYVSPTFGGCVTVTPLAYPEGHSGFIGKKGASGLQSASFIPRFPAAFRLAPAGNTGDCIEFHWPISAYNIILLFIFTALFTPPPHVLATVLIVLGYLQITLVSDPRYRPPEWSYILGGLPAVLLAGYWFWNVSLRTTICGFVTAGLVLDLAIWQGAGFWIGIESSTLFAKIPISRLGYGALGASGIIALVIIIVIVACVVILQALEFRKLGYLRYYLKRYLPLIPILIILANLGDGYYLRLHHYLLCIAGIPVLSLPNRTSAFGQAFLLGFFLDGVGRWGWASIVEHASDLLGDAAAGTFLPVLNSTSSYMTWVPLNETLTSWGITAITILFDDIVFDDQFKGTNFSVALTGADLSVDHYFRMAFIGNGTSLDFTDPWTWFAANQSWGGIGGA